MEPTDQIPEGLPNNPQLIKPIKAIQGSNSGGRVGYTGPCPPGKEIHTYYFNVYGLDSLLDLKPGADRKMLERAMERHMVQYGGQAIANYRRK